MCSTIQVSLDLAVCVCHATENGSLRLFRQEKLPGKTRSVLKGLTLMHLSNTDKGNSNQYHKLNFYWQSIFWIVLCVLDSRYVCNHDTNCLHQLYKLQGFKFTYIVKVIHSKKATRFEKKISHLVMTSLSKCQNQKG